MAPDSRALIGDTLDDLVAGLGPFVDAVFAERLPAGPTWVRVIAEKDRLAGRPTQHHHADDVGLILRVLTERLGTLGFPFDGKLSRQAANWASELREVRNRHAHQVAFTMGETYRAIDSAELLLREVGAADQASRVAERKPHVLAALSGGRGRPLPPPPAAAPTQAHGTDAGGGPASEDPTQEGSAAPATEPTGLAVVDESSPSPLSRRALREAAALDGGAVADGMASDAAPGVAAADVDAPGVAAADVDAAVNAPGVADGVTHPRVTLSIAAVGELSYAMAHVRIVPLHEVRVTYHGPPLGGASLTIEATCAAGSLGDPKVLIVDLAPGETILSGPDLLSLDPAAMLQVDTQQPGSLVATLRAPDGSVLGEHRHPVVVLAANQWIARELHLGLELLPAYVQPQAAELTAVLQAASDRLAASTGSGSLNGYQSEDPSRVDAMVHAVWDAMRARDIRYANPPASWGLSGQKVRTPHEVLGDRLGTCLDTTVTLAALLEQIGLNSTLWLTEDHILLGYWRDGGSLGVAATTDVEEVVNLVGLGRIALVETTAVTAGVEFDQARAVARPFVEGRRDDVLGITDVRGARENHILPLPSRSVGADGAVTVVEYAPETRILAPFVAPPRTQSPRDAAPPRIAQWKNALLDLSLRNRLINFTDRAGHLLAVPGQALARLEDMVNGGSSLTLMASDDVPQVARERGIRFGRDLPAGDREALLAERRQVYLGDVTAAAYTTRLRALAAKARTVVEETGANNLYLAFGTLQWEWGDRALQSPLVLVPVTLEAVSRGRSFRLKLDEAGASTPNYCLLEKLKVSYGIEIPGLADPVTDASGIDLAAAFAAVRQAMVDARRPFVVDETVHLAILQFAKFRLWKDLDDNWEQFTSNPLVTHLVHAPTDAFVDDAAAPADLDLDALGHQVPVGADSSQLEAVAEAVAGRTFVLEGPPGTGKSQTITNLLARALAAGRRVLFVAEKRAALDVVKERLHAVGLGAFSLDLHDKGARPNAVREQLRAALDATARPDRAALAAQREAVEASGGALARYAQRLHEANAAGLSLYSAHDAELAADATVAELPVPAAFAATGTAQDFAEVRSVLRSLPAVSDLARPAPRHPWGFVDAADVDVVRAHAAARSFDAALDAALAAVEGDALVGRVRTFEQVEAWAGVVGAPRHPVGGIDALRPDEVERVAAQVRTLAAATPPWTARVDPRVLAHDVAALHAAALAADASSFFGRRKRRRAVRDSLSADLRVAPETIGLRDLSRLTGELAETLARLDAVRDELRRLPVAVADEGFNPFLPGGADDVLAALAWAAWVARTLGAQPSAAGELRDDLRVVYAGRPADAARAEVLRDLAGTWRGLIDATGNAGDTERLATWAGEDGVAAAWVATRTGRDLTGAEPVTLTRWIDLVRHVEPLRRHGLLAARTVLLEGRVPADDASLAFDRGVASASVRERADATGLADFDASAQDRTVSRFTRSSSAVRAVLPQEIPAQILARRRFDPAYDGGDMGALKRQLARQRGGDSVRALMEKYGGLITQITPCMLMSPESVARFFPARADMFDIVVFDEASQIRVADAVGAMGRGRSVVVVGDSKQMPPSTFAEITADADDSQVDAGLVLDEESILTECTQARVPSKWLSWHYRSQDEALIAFSNARYYEGRLSSFPAPLPPASSAGPAADHGISLVRVDGRFLRSGVGGALRTNPVEATAIVEEVSRRFAAAEGTPSLGIITFNVQQRALIENMLRDAADERIGQALDAPDGLFVKNLESVQGDERDTILFSVAFSANDRGALPLNFGPLSRAGGERRLNVAVTRARRQVVLYASFDPSELRAEQTSSQGIKDLKAYLELAARSAVVDEGGAARAATVDRHREDIARELRGRGLVVTTDVGLSDFRVDLSLAAASAPEQPLVAVLLDGEGWRARRTVADRDGLPVVVLRDLMQWPGVERVWLPEWLADRDAALTRLVAAVDAAAAGAGGEAGGEAAASGTVVHRDAGGEAPGEEAAGGTVVHRDAGEAAGGTVVLGDEGDAAADAPAAADPDTVAPQESGSVPVGAAADVQTGGGLGIRHADVTAFVPWTPPRLGSIEVLDALPGPRAAQQVRAAVVAALQHEGPVARVRLAKLVAEAFGLHRVAGSRAGAILRLLPDSAARGSETEIVWPDGLDPATWRGVRVNDGDEMRPLEHISLVEIANAMAIVAQLGGGMGEDDLMREALRLLGGRRVTAQISARLRAALDVAVATGRITASPSGAWVAVG